jgi:hypothetical protein
MRIIIRMERMRKMKVLKIAIILISISFIMSCSVGTGRESIIGPTQPGNIQTLTIPNLTVITIEIGDWDMDKYGTKSVAHQLTDINTIRMITCVMRNDNGTSIYTMANAFTNDLFYAYCDLTLSSIDTTNVNLQRIPLPGKFDSKNFDNTSYNRGWITIWYEE